MSHAHPRADHEHEHDRPDDHDNGDRHPALTPLVIDLIPEQTRAELEASIDEPLTVERGPAEWTSENGGEI